MPSQNPHLPTASKASTIGTDNVLMDVGKGYTKSWEKHYAYVEKQRIEKLWGKPPVAVVTEEMGKLTETFEKEGGVSGAMEVLDRILGPHDRFRSCMNEMVMLFQNVDVAGERRREAMRIVAAHEKARVDALAEEQGLSQHTDSQSKNLSDLAVALSKPKWYEVVENGAVKHGWEDEFVANALKNPSAGGHEPKAAKDDTKHRRESSHVKINHRSFHNVLSLTRSYVTSNRNLRQRTHALKRVVLAELFRLCYYRDRVWYNEWSDQERFLGLAVQAERKAALERSASVKVSKEVEEEIEKKKKEREMRELRRLTAVKPRRRTSVVIGGRLVVTEDDDDDDDDEKDKQDKQDKQDKRDKQDDKPTPMEDLQGCMDSTTVLPKPYHSLPFFFNLMKYDQSRAFDRAKWVKWRAKREQLRDLELRRDDLDEELRRVTFVAVCPLISKHTRANVHCTKCDRRIIKSRDMWLTIIAEPLTKIESLLELSYVSTYCEIELEKNEKHRHTLEKEILQLELILFGMCAEYLQIKYALHVGYFLAKERESAVHKSVENYKDRRFEDMCKFVREGKTSTEELYIKYAEIEEKLEGYLHFNAMLRRRRLRFATKKIIRIWRQRKRMREIQAKIDEEENNAEQRARLQMIAAEKDAFEAVLKRKGLEEMKVAMQKRLEKHARDNTFTCHRRECKNREFNSLDRFKLHEKLHYNADVKENLRLAEKKKKADERKKKEQIFMDELKEKKQRQREEAGLSSVAANPKEKQVLFDILQLAVEQENEKLNFQTFKPPPLDENPVQPITDDLHSLDSQSQSQQSFDQMDVSEFFRITAPASFAQHIQHFSERPSSPSIPSLFLNHAKNMDLPVSAISSVPSSLGNSPRDPLTALLEEERRRLTDAGDDVSLSNSVGTLDYSLASSLTDDFYSDQDFLSARSSVTGVDLDDVIQELIGSKQKFHDNLSSPSLTLISTNIMASEDLPQEIFLNKTLIRVGRSDKCDVVLKPMVNLHMIAKVHMLIYTTWNSDGGIELFVRDNKTKYGVYMLNVNGAKRCPGLTTLVDPGYYLKHGDKLCVCKDFGEGASFEIVYKVTMPEGKARAKKGAVDVIAASRTNLKEIPKLVESSNEWWEEEKGSVGGRSVQSRIERLRRLAKGEQVSARGGDRSSSSSVSRGGGGGGSSMSLPDLKTRVKNVPNRLFGEREEEEEGEEGNGLYNDGDSIDSSLGFSLGSIDESSVEGSLMGSSVVESVQSSKSVPVSKSKFMLVGQKGEGDRELKYNLKRELAKKYGGGKVKNLLAAKRGLNVVDGKIVVEYL